MPLHGSWEVAGGGVGQQGKAEIEEVSWTPGRGGVGSQAVPESQPDGELLRINTCSQVTE